MGSSRRWALDTGSRREQGCGERRAEPQVLMQSQVPPVRGRARELARSLARGDRNVHSPACPSDAYRQVRGVRAPAFAYGWRTQGSSARQRCRSNGTPSVQPIVARRAPSRRLPLDVRGRCSLDTVPAAAERSTIRDDAAPADGAWAWSTRIRAATTTARGAATAS